MCQLFSKETTKIKNDYYARIFCSMLCKDHNVVLAEIKFYNVEAFRNSFLPFTVNELKLDSEIKKMNPILLSARPLENHNNKIYDTFGITETETKFSVI